MHSKCWDYLVNIQKRDNSFYFVPRKINKYNRLEQGYFFIGNDEYLQISFWDGGDTYEKIHNISWGVENNGLCFIEISAKDNKVRAKFLAQLVSILEQKTGTVYNEIKKGKWRYNYSKEIFYLDSLQSFIDIEKPLIDEFIIRHPETGISMLDKDFNERYVLKHLPGKAKNQNQKRTKKKLEGVVSVSPSSYLMTLHHNELQNALLDFLKTDSNNVSVVSEDKNVDITVNTATGEKIFYELKTCDVKQAIRLAIGQLLEYSHYCNKSKVDKMIIVTKYSPSNNDITYMQKLRDLYQMPIYYQQFDMEKKQMSILY